MFLVYTWIFLKKYNFVNFACFKFVLFVYNIFYLMTPGLDIHFKSFAVIFRPLRNISTWMCGRLPLLGAVDLSLRTATLSSSARDRTFCWTSILRSLRLSSSEVGLCWLLMNLSMSVLNCNEIQFQEMLQ